jgi:NAD(P)-dependent dehydrogenase (short-subunit alcohol dehydrogenase family)
MATQPPQHQSHQPGTESEMTPKPKADNAEQVGSGKLIGKIALITGGDSGIGRAVAYAFAREGADILIAYLNEHDDAKETKEHVEKEYGRRCECMAGDLGREEVCQQVVKKTIEAFGRIDILVNNGAEQHPQQNFEDISGEQLERTFRTNIFAYFYLTKAALPYLEEGSVILNTTSVTAYKGNAVLIDYSATKGAIVAFTRSLSQALVEKNIRVNGVAPGPIWTPLIPASFDAKKVAEFGSDVPMKRVGQPEEVAPCYVFLASQDASYMTGQILHPNGGTIVNG